jgi:uncharacterized OsmC-like protein
MGNPTPPRFEDNSAAVSVRGNASGFAQNIGAGRHQLKSDEPVEVGGTDRGPSPYNLLLAALGSCTSMTVALYARRKNWPLEDVTVRLQHSRIYATDCAECETKAGVLDRIEREIVLTGSLIYEQRTRLLVTIPYCGSRAELMEVIAMARDGRIHAETTEFRLEQAVDVYAKRKAGQIPGRAVLVPTPA